MYRQRAFISELKTRLVQNVHMISLRLLRATVPGERQIFIISYTTDAQAGTKTMRNRPPSKKNHHPPSGFPPNAYRHASKRLDASYRIGQLLRSLCSKNPLPRRHLERFFCRRHVRHCLRLERRTRLHANLPIRYTLVRLRASLSSIIRNIL